MTTQNAINTTTNIYVHSVNLQIFTSSGTYTPSAGLIGAIIKCVGGGGAGGGTPTASASTVSIGGGGQSGAYSEGYYTAATLGASQTVTIGSGGTGVANATGGNGSTTSVGTIITAPGGSGGLAGQVGAWSLTGTTYSPNAGTGQIALTGNSPQALLVAQAAGTMVSAPGASSMLGPGAHAAGGSNSVGTNADANSGAGGSGAVINSTVGTTKAGGNGGSGLVLIYEFIAA